MNQFPVEMETNTSRDGNLIEGAFKAVWEKARAASDLIRQLREEKRGLSQRIVELEIELQKLQSASGKQDQELRSLKAEHAQLVNASDDNVLSADEKERLKSKVRDLIAKINSYL